MLWSILFQAVGTSTYLPRYNRWGYKVKHCKYNTFISDIVGALYCYWLIILSKNWDYFGDFLYPLDGYHARSCSDLNFQLYKGQIRPILYSSLRILHTCPGSSNNVNYIHSVFLRHCDSCLDSFSLFLVVTDVFHTFIVTKLYFSNTLLLARVMQICSY